MLELFWQTVGWSVILWAMVAFIAARQTTHNSHPLGAEIILSLLTGIVGGVIQAVVIALASTIPPHHGLIALIGCVFIASLIRRQSG